VPVVSKLLLAPGFVDKDEASLPGKAVVDLIRKGTVATEVKFD